MTLRAPSARPGPRMYQPRISTPHTPRKSRSDPYPVLYPRPRPHRALADPPPGTMTPPHAGNTTRPSAPPLRRTHDTQC